jgi:hypothetical protein
MMTLEGRGYGSAPVYAPAAVLGDSDGRPTLPTDLLTLALRNIRLGNEPQDVVLVAENAAIALLTPLPPGLTLAGVVAEQDMPPPANTRLSVVTGVSGAREALESAALVVLDPARGRVLVDPEASEIVRLQEETHRARYLLGAAHTPAATQSGREITVWATLLYRGEIPGALEEGADGIVVQPFGDLLVGGEEMVRELQSAAEIIGGGDVTLIAGPDLLTPAMAVALASRCRLRWALSRHDLSVRVADLRKELDTLVAEERTAGRIVARPLLVGYAADLTDPETTHFDELLMEAEEIASLSAEQALSLPPFRAVLGEALEYLPAAVNAGAAGVIVLPDRVAEAKEIIREQE